MGAYLFNGWISQMEIKSEHGGGGCQSCAGEADLCAGYIVCAETVEAAYAKFQEMLLRGNQASPPVPTQIRKIVCAPVLDKLLTETGFEAIDWATISQRVETNLQETAGDDFEQGQWVDINAEVSPQKLAVDIATLRRGLAGDIESGLNWSEGKQFFFLISALTPSEPIPEPDYDGEVGSAEPEETEEEGGENFRFISTTDTERRARDFPQLAEREAVVLIQARNSVVAAWLWRRHAAENELGSNDIRADWWGGVMGLEAGDKQL